MPMRAQVAMPRVVTPNLAVFAGPLWEAPAYNAPTYSLHQGAHPLQFVQFHPLLASPAGEASWTAAAMHFGD